MKKQIRARDPQHQLILQSIVDGTFLENDDEPFDPQHVVEARCINGCSALHWACGSNHVAIAQRLLVAPYSIPADLPCTARSTKGRTPLHYAARNGCLETAQLLVQVYGCDPNPLARHGVSPFQLAVFQNQLPLAQWLVEKCRVDPFQVNDFGCGAGHWLAICPQQQRSLLPLARWLTSLGLDWTISQQKQGHTPFHKAAWLGHTELLVYLHETHQLYDDRPDHAGNYAVDLATMAGHTDTVEWIRVQASRDRAESCAILHLEASCPHYSAATLRQAYLRRVRTTHPDRRCCTTTVTAKNDDDFCAITAAYRHLTVEQGRGRQGNPRHALPPLVLSQQQQDSTASRVQNDNDTTSTTHQRLRVVLAEYGSGGGVELSNLKKKWHQVWRDIPFPSYSGTSLRRYVEGLPGIHVVQDSGGCWRVVQVVNPTMTTLGQCNRTSSGT